MARRRDNEPDRPYRWSDTPIDPLGGRRAPGSRRWVGWLVLAVVLLGFFGVRQGWFRTDQRSGPDRPARTSTTTTPVSTSAATSPPVTASPGPAAVGTPLRDGLVLVTLHTVDRSESQGPFGPESTLTASVTISNAERERLSYSVLDWELQFPDGHTERPGAGLGTDALGLAGEVISGGKVTGTVTFDVTGGPAGTYQVNYRPMLDQRPTQLSWAVPFG